LLHGDDSVDILINGIKIERVRYVKFMYRRIPTVGWTYSTNHQ